MGLVPFLFYGDLHTSEQDCLAITTILHHNSGLWWLKGGAGVSDLNILIIYIPKYVDVIV